MLLWGGGIALALMLAMVPYFNSVVRLAFIAICVVLMWLAWAFHGVGLLANTLAKDAPTTEAFARLGQTGDIFGGINALFAALAFCGVAIAAYLQFGTYRHARVQAFEGSFYSALDLLHRIAEGLAFTSTILEKQGVDAELANTMRIATKRYGFSFRPASDLEPGKKPTFEGRLVFPAIVKSIAERASDPKHVLKTYKVLQAKHNYVLGHYFRHLYQVLKLVDRQPSEILTASDKYTYTGILRAQLSSSELALLFLNCLDDAVDEGQFRNLVIRYRMLEHFPIYLQKGVFRAREENLALGDNATLAAFLEQVVVVKKNTAYRGAFGSNPDTAGLLPKV